MEDYESGCMQRLTDSSALHELSYSIEWWENLENTFASRQSTHTI